MLNGFHTRRDRLIEERHHDTYRGRDKCSQHSLCTRCGALFENGRWTWNKPPEKHYSVTCPSCRRIAENYPAGSIRIKGAFYKNHKEEILNLVRNVETQEKGEHPLERIMAISHSDGTTLVTTTGIHVARRIGESLSRSYKGEYSFQYADGEQSIRVYWER